jgi:predicted Zn-dependent peptidase
MKKAWSRRLQRIYVLLALFLSGQSAAQELRLDVREQTLANGLKVLLLERRDVPVFSSCIYYRVGSVNESIGSTGISHFIEHLMWKGTRTLGAKDFVAEEEIMREKDEVMTRLDAERRRRDPRAEVIQNLEARFEELDAEHKKLIVSNEIDKVYTENGATGINASTSYDWTNYYLSLPANRLELWCAVESDIMRYPVFREFYQERGVVQEERRWRYETNPGGALYEQLTAAAYVAHPYGRPVIGVMSDIENYTPKQVRDFHKQYYAPNQAVVCVVGDVRADKVLEMVEKYFGSIPRQPEPPPLVTAEPEQKGERRVAVEFDANPQVGIAFHKVAMTHPDQPVFDVLAQILSSGRTSRLYRKLVEELQIAVEVWSGDLESKYPDLYFVFVEPRAPHTLEEVEAAVYAELERLKEEPVSEWELQRAKNRLEANFIASLESNEGLAARIGFYEMIDDWRLINSVLERWKAVSAEDIRRVAATYFTRSNRTVAFIEQVSPAE